MGISTAVDASAVARVVGIKTEFVDNRGGRTVFLPQRIAVIGQGATASVYATTKRRVLSAVEAGQLYGFGSPVHLAVKQLLPANGDGVGTIPVTVYPLDDGAGSLVAAGDITPTGTATENGSVVVMINNIPSATISIASGELGTALEARVADAINANLDSPMIAAAGVDVVDLTSKWKGASANDLTIEIVGSVAGISWAVTQPVGGTANPDVDTALAQVGDVWESLVLNCMDLADTSTLDKFQAWGDGRWGALTRKPAVVFTGNPETTVTAAIAIPDARKTDKVNVAVPMPASSELPFVIAARVLSRVAPRANNQPGYDFGSLPLTGLTPGVDGSQWDYPSRDAAVKGGSSTIEVKDGVANISDLVTFYHPSGDPTPAYRYVVDIIKLQNIIFNLDLEFASTKWDGKILVPDADTVVVDYAVQPKDARAAAGSITDNLGLNGLISDAAGTKANTRAAINDSNPKRLDMVVPVSLSGNANIISMDLDFGFYFGPTGG